MNLEDKKIVGRSFLHYKWPIEKCMSSPIAYNPMLCHIYEKLEELTRIAKLIIGEEIEEDQENDEKAT